MVTTTQTSFENECNTRKELAQRIHKVIKDRYNQSQVDCDKQSSERELQNESMMAFMKEQVTGVIVQMQRDREETDTRYNQLTADLDRQCQEIRDMLIQECTQRDE